MRRYARCSFFWRLGAIPLIGFDEGSYAECSREMLASGDWVVPTCNGGPFFDKPPAAFWLQAASMRAFGVNSFAARLPSAVESLALVALTVFLGTRLFSRRAGLMAGFALATSTLAAGLARLAIIDALFTLTITASLGAFLLAYLPENGTEPFPQPRRAAETGAAEKRCLSPFFLVFWAGMGGSMMVKGPAGPVLILATVLVFLLIRRDLRAIRRAMPVAGIVLAAAIALPWYVAVNERTGGAFVREFIVHQNLQRALGKDFQHNAPFYYYVPVLAAAFFPWSVFLPAALSSRKHETEKARNRSGIASLFLTVWIGVVFVTFSALRSKLPGYMFPIYPAAALMVARLWSNAIDEKGATLRRSVLAAAAAACTAAAVMLIVPPYLREPIPGLMTALIPMSAALVLGCAAAYVLVMAGRPMAAFGALCAGMTAFVGVIVYVGLPIAARPNAIPAMELGRSLSEVYALTYAWDLSPPQPQIAFYAGRPIEQADVLPHVPCSHILVAQADRLAGVPPGAVQQGRIGPYVLLDCPPR